MDALKNQIARECGGLRRVVEIALLSLPVLWAMDMVQSYMDGHIPYGPAPTSEDMAGPWTWSIAQMPLWLQAVVAGLRLMEWLPVGLILLALRDLLGEWKVGALFTLNTAAHMRRMGHGLIVLFFLALLTSAALGPLGALAGISPLAMHLNANIVALLIGVVVLALARIMRVGVMLQDQADLTF